MRVYSADLTHATLFSITDNWYSYRQTSIAKETPNQNSPVILGNPTPEIFRFSDSQSGLHVTLSRMIVIVSLRTQGFQPARSRKHQMNTSGNGTFPVLDRPVASVAITSSTSVVLDQSLRTDRLHCFMSGRTASLMRRIHRASILRP